MILGAACLVAIAYFVWLFLAPPPSSPAVENNIITELDTSVVGSGGFQALREFVKLPIRAGSVGRPDPFASLSPASSLNANSPVNAPLNANTSQ